MFSSLPSAPRADVMIRWLFGARIDGANWVQHHQR
jgi:hypothetical protein